MWVPKRPVPIKHAVGALITRVWIIGAESHWRRSSEKARTQSLFSWSQEEVKQEYRVNNLGE